MTKEKKPQYAKETKFAKFLSMHLHTFGNKKIPLQNEKIYSARWSQILSQAETNFSIKVFFYFFLFCTCLLCEKFEADDSQKFMRTKFSKFFSFLYNIYFRTYCI